MLQPLAILMRENDISGASKGRQVVGVASVALICPTLTLCFRSYVRLVIQKRLGKDDYFAAASLCILSSLCILLIHSCYQFGLGSHLSTLSSSSIVGLVHATFVCQILYILTTALTKFSIGFYFLRLTRKLYQRLMIWTVMFIVASFSFVYLAFVSFQCRPADYLWLQNDPKNLSGSCLSRSSMADITYAHASISCLSDWAFGILPILILWKLDMKFKTKLSVMIVLSLSIVASVATVIRIVHLHTLKSLSESNWEGIGLIKWSLIEPAVALTAANIATLRPLTQKIFSKKRRQSRQRPPKLSLNAIRGLSRKSSVCYSSEFADMLGLAVSPGVKTRVYADRTLDTTTNQKSPIFWSRWRDSEVRLLSPLRSPLRSPLSPTQHELSETDRKSTISGWHKQQYEGEGRTASLGLGSIKSGRWIVKTSPGIGIMKTIVVTRESGLRTTDNISDGASNLR
ncbi:putative integral membrane protein [Erysiphe neolycopersici]|uniref:Putative integral membrane protein n=1 Tax=Erysiphe neolycopersici TaxID=212602 RepID=A0A420HUW5_9PEZI|nr:putative integral membrane protein [Erysiphe neolycopersici]